MLHNYESYCQKDGNETNMNLGIIVIIHHYYFPYSEKKNYNMHEKFNQILA